MEYRLKPREQPLAIYGPKGTEEAIMSLVRVSFPDTAPEALIMDSKPEFYTLADGTAFESTDGPIIQAVRVAHKKTETYGLVVSDDSHRLFFSADTALFDGLDEIVGSCHCSIMDATTLDVPLPGHMSYREVASMASRFPAQSFFVTHRSIYAPDTILDNLLIPEDGEAYDIWTSENPILISDVPNGA
jgi:ribonuclease BN (tRNA processing enzyme)